MIKAKLSTLLQNRLENLVIGDSCNLVFTHGSRGRVNAELSKTTIKILVSYAYI